MVRQGWKCIFKFDKNILVSGWRTIFFPVGANMVRHPFQDIFCSVLVRHFPCWRLFWRTLLHLHMVALGTIGPSTLYMWIFSSVSYKSGCSFCYFAIFLLVQKISTFGMNMAGGMITFCLASKKIKMYPSFFSSGGFYYLKIGFYLPILIFLSDQYFSFPFEFLSNPFLGRKIFFYRMIVQVIPGKCCYCAVVQSAQFSHNLKYICF